MDDTYKSTIVSWFENNINNILVKIPMETSTSTEMVTSYEDRQMLIFLYKESDALAVKVLETIPILHLPIFPSSISFNDPHIMRCTVQRTKYFLDYITTLQLNHTKLYLIIK